MNLAVEVGDHIYTTDYYQQSAFNPDDQIISIYYFVKPLEPIMLSLTNYKFDFTEDQLKFIKKNRKLKLFVLLI